MSLEEDPLKNPYVTHPPLQCPCCRTYIHPAWNEKHQCGNWMCGACGATGPYRGVDAGWPGIPVLPPSSGECPWCGSGDVLHDRESLEWSCDACLSRGRLREAFRRTGMGPLEYMSVEPLVSCLCCTYGRFTVLRDALACFAAQTYRNRELVILNNHPMPLRSDLRHVRIINEPGHPTLGDCRNRIIQEARGAFVRTWDDDDLYMPWTLTQGVCSIGDAPAFKPARSWSTDTSDLWDLHDNVFEAAMLVRADLAKDVSYTPGSGGDEHMTLLAGIDSKGGCKKIERGWAASYVYRWGWGFWHISGSLGDGRTVHERTAEWMAKHQDTGNGELLTPSNLTPLWKMLCDHAEGPLPSEDVGRLKNALGV